MFESVETSFVFNRCRRQGSVEALRWSTVGGKKKATQLLANVEEGWIKKRMAIIRDVEGERAHQICSFMWAENFWIMSHSKKVCGADATGSVTRSK